MKRTVRPVDFWLGRALQATARQSIAGKGDVNVSLSVKDILEKTFNRSFKGYNEDEVDQFLDQIIDELKALDTEIQKLRSENAGLQKVLNTQKQHREKIKETEETIMNTLVSAQKSSERVMREAARKAEMIIDSAENTAKQRVAQTESDVKEAERRLEDIRESAKHFAEKFTDLVNTTAAAFAGKYQASFGSAPAGGINAAALSKIDQEIARSLRDIETPEETGNTAEADKVRDDVSNDAAVQTAAGADEAPEDAGNIAHSADNDAGLQKGLMELHEINRALSELEEQDDVLQDAQDADAPKGRPEFSDYKQKYNDYSWLYDSDGQAADEQKSVKEPEDKDQLKSLIDEIID
jgi:cell division initiation protein